MHVHEHPIIYHPSHSSEGFTIKYKKSAQMVKPFLTYCNLKNLAIWLVDTVLNRNWRTGCDPIMRCSPKWALYKSLIWQKKNRNETLIWIWAEPILIYLNLTKPKNQKIHGKNTCMYMNIRLFIIHPILRMVLQWNTIWKSNQISVCSFRSRDLRVWKVVPKGPRPTPPLTRAQISHELDFF